jgi:glycosyltransferase involved in cell wall biosynthesis
LLLKALRRLGWNETLTTLAWSADAPEYLAELKQAAEGLTVEFRGALGDVELREFLGSLDILVLPSLWAENLPFVLLEAQAARVPVLASDVAGSRERIPDQRLLFRPNDPVSLANALEGFLNDSNYHPPPPPLSVEEMAERTEAVYSRAIRRVGRAK